MKDIKVDLIIETDRANKDFTTKPLMKTYTPIDCLLQNCKFCFSNVRKKNQFYEIRPSIVVMFSHEDKDFWQTFLRSHTSEIELYSTQIESKLVSMANYIEKKSPDFIVRLRDCNYNVPALTLNKAIFTAVHRRLDYLTNSWPEFRTSIVGQDCEVFSARAIKAIMQNFSKVLDSDHIDYGAFIRRHKLNLNCGSLWSREDLSEFSCKISSKEDLEAAAKRFDRSSEKKRLATGFGLEVFEY